MVNSLSWGRAATMTNTSDGSIEMSQTERLFINYCEISYCFAGISTDAKETATKNVPFFSHLREDTDILCFTTSANSTLLYSNLEY